MLKSRESYLAGFDGSILSSGSHKVVGTVLIRTSDDLNATKQKNLEEKNCKGTKWIKIKKDKQLLWKKY